MADEAPPTEVVSSPDSAPEEEQVVVAEETVETGQVLSKNQQKKLAKRARMVEQRTARKLNRKEQVQTPDKRCVFFQLCTRRGLILPWACRKPAWAWCCCCGPPC